MEEGKWEAEDQKMENLRQEMEDINDKKWYTTIGTWVCILLKTLLYGGSFVMYFHGTKMSAENHVIFFVTMILMALEWLGVSIVFVIKRFRRSIGVKFGQTAFAALSLLFSLWGSFSQMEFRPAVVCAVIQFVGFVSQIMFIFAAIVLMQKAQDMRKMYPNMDYQNDSHSPLNMDPNHVNEPLPGAGEVGSDDKKRRKSPAKVNSTSNPPPPPSITPASNVPLSNGTMPGSMSMTQAHSGTAPMNKPHHHHQLGMENSFHQNQGGHNGAMMKHANMGNNKPVQIPGVNLSTGMSMIATKPPQPHPKPPVREMPNSVAVYPNMAYQDDSPLNMDPNHMNKPLPGMGSSMEVVPMGMPNDPNDQMVNF